MSKQKGASKRRNPTHKAESTICQKRKLKRMVKHNGHAPARARAMAMGLITWFDGVFPR